MKRLIFLLFFAGFFACEDDQAKKDEMHTLSRLLDPGSATTGGSGDCRIIPSSYTIPATSQIFVCSASGFTVTCTDNNTETNIYEFGSYLAFKASTIDLPTFRNVFLVGFRGSKITNIIEDQSGTQTVEVSFSSNGADLVQTSIGSGLPNGASLITPINYSQADAHGNYTVSTVASSNSSIAYSYTGSLVSQIVDNFGTREYNDGRLTKFTGSGSSAGDFEVTSTSGSLTLCAP
ncbi:hypothetical protein EHO57_13830 [Leptospira langatensis]|uniref:Lipoprotein n=1 Tax=Leptospira langatensis TaxID=2484983 RepID=A0A5R2ASY1_9LEPT|nr:hypothetical protein [Leptospira langatensis]TGJ99836.1 hypothetical protein EHO57_13830 [Leptospira langatensis]